MWCEKYLIFMIMQIGNKEMGLNFVIRTQKGRSPFVIQHASLSKNYKIGVVKSLSFKNA